MVQMDLVTFDGSVEQCEAIRQFGRDFVWDLARGERLEDPAFAVDQAVADIVAAIDGEPNPEAVERLRGELLKSAERANAEQHVMSIEKATELGTRAGRDAVDEFAAELRTDADEDLGQFDDAEVQEALMRTLRAGHVPWSEGAAAAGAHALDGVPSTDELRAAYYRAYDAGAQARIEELYAK